MEKINKTPTSVSVIAWYFKAGGIILVLLGILAPLLLLSLSEVNGSPNQLGWLLFIGGGIVLVILGVLYFLVGRSLDKLRSWARLTAIALSILGIIISISSIFVFDDYIGVVFEIVISGLITYHLSKKEIKVLFD